MNRKHGISESTVGTISALLAFTLWGILPLYWKMIHQIPPLEILAHRIFWSFILVTGLLTYRNEWKEIKTVLQQKGKMGIIILAAAAITMNWGIYIWAVNTGCLVEASLGYYINPLLAVFLGMTLFKEKLSRWQITSLALAAVGVGILTIQYGRVPWIAFTLAVSFALYGVLKKLVKVSAMVSFALETAVTAPIAILYIISKQVEGTGALGFSSIGTTLLLVGAGVVTAIPLLLFAHGAQRIQLSTLGFTQFIAPTISLLIGIFIFHEQFTPTHMLSFSFIWCALLLYSISQTHLVRKEFLLQVAIQKE
jgi:chloramphenicol-sensitive protein RarD